MPEYFAHLKWLIRSLQTPAGFGESRGGIALSQQAPSSMGWLLPHGLLCWGLTPVTNTRQQRHLPPVWQVVEYRARWENLTSSVVVWDNFTISLFFCVNCVHYFSSLKCAPPPKHLQALGPKNHPLARKHWSCQTLFLHGSQQPCSMPQLSHSSPGEIIFSSRRWFVWSQRRLHDRCFSGREAPPVPLAAHPPNSQTVWSVVWRYAELWVGPSVEQRCQNLCSLSEARTDVGSELVELLMLRVAVGQTLYSE